MTRRRWTVAAAAVTVLVGCSSSHSTPVVAEAHHQHEAVAIELPERELVVAPQGREPQFLARCDFSHAAADDPIVLPGRPGASHLHVFFGSTIADADSTPAELVAGPTTCDQTLDRAAYWAPALLDGDRVVEPDRAVAYYRAGVGTDPADVAPYPAGLAMIAGDPAATSPQPLWQVNWSCGGGVARTSAPRTCPDAVGMYLTVVFPNCWDGMHTDVADHRSHMAYSSASGCPASHPVVVPELTFTIQYPRRVAAEGLTLSSGPLLGAHADFLDGWDPAGLAREVALCLHRYEVCGVAR